MLKKSLIFGSAALFLAALITLTGCPTSADDDGSSGLVYAHRIYGDEVNPYQAQEAIDRAVAAGEPIVLENNLTIVPSGALNFKDARVVINGTVTFTNGVISVVDAAVSWADGAWLDLGTGAYIHRQGSDISHVNEDNLVEYAETLDAIMPTAFAAAVRRFQLGELQNYDYSTGTPVDARVSDPYLRVLYVLDELTINRDAVNPDTNLSIAALGTVDVIGTPPQLGGHRRRLKRAPPPGDLFHPDQQQRDRYHNRTRDQW
jgi:hypothetical protein